MVHIKSLFQPIKPQSAVLDSQAMISAVSLSTDHHHHCRDGAAGSVLLLSPCVGTIKETQVQHFSQHWFCHKIITDTPTAAGKVPCHHPAAIGVTFISAVVTQTDVFDINNGLIVQLQAPTFNNKFNV